MGWIRMGGMSNQYILNKPMTSVSDAVPTLNHHLLLIHGLSNITKIPTITTCVVGIMEESFVFGVEVLFPNKGYTAQQRFGVLYLTVEEAVAKRQYLKRSAKRQYLVT